MQIIATNYPYPSSSPRLSLSYARWDYPTFIQYIYPNLRMSVMRRRVFLVQKFIHMLIVVRLFTTSLFPLEFFVPFLVAMLVAQYIKQGFTPLLLALLPLISLQIFAEIHQILQLQYIVAILGGVLHFVPIKLYWLPQSLKVVGFREDSLEGGLHYYQFHPLDETEAVKLTSMKWHLGLEVAKMLDYKGITNRLLKRFGHLIMSYVDHYNLKVGQGTELISDSGIAFCHGRGGTPLLYTSYLMHFAGEKFRVGAVQHSEVSRTQYTAKEDIKRYREKEVQVRAAEYYQAILKVGRRRMVLMGHSYGCATAIQAYHSLQPQLRQKVSHIVLLDPWFFPLPDSKFSQEIQCPVLILANEDFIMNPDVYQRNKAFIAKHKVEYVLWREGHHLHQTDLGFINGNLLGAVKFSHLSKVMLDLNITAIDRFLRGEKVEGTFGERDLGRDFKPSKFHPENMFTL